MRTLERLARTASRQDARIMALLVWPGLAGLAAWFAWLCVVLLHRGSAFSEPVAWALMVGMVVWWLLHPLALLCLVLAIFRRGRHRWSAILANGFFLLVSVLVLAHGIT